MKTAVMALMTLMTAVTVAAAPAPDSKRLALAKEYIADEQWRRAISELRVVANDAADANRDEALFWLAHSEHQVGDQAAAIATIVQLERLFPRSRWVRPARSLRVEIAQRLNRDDVLWVLAVPPPPTAMQPTPMSPSTLPVPRGSTAAPGARPPLMPRPPMTPPESATPPPPSATVLPPGMPPTTAPPGVPPTPMATPPPGKFVRSRPVPQPGPPPEGLLPMTPYVFDTEIQIEALAGLLDAHSDRVIPLLRDIALDSKNPNEARRAVFALARSRRPEARNTVVEAARRGPKVVRIAAIRELGRFEDGTFTAALLGIARGESDPVVRDTAIVTLGRSGARTQLRTLYTQVPGPARFSVITALFNARDDDELIRIATKERDQRLRTSARQQLRLLSTPKAVKFLADNP
jgi:hypothetical protein